MSLGIVLDVIIGLAFTYLLLSILVSGLQEIIAGAMSLRGAKLQKGIIALLADADPKVRSKLFEKVFNHPLISDLSKNRLPSYVPSRNFSMALVEALKSGTASPGALIAQVESTIGTLPDGKAKQSLLAMLTQAEGDIHKFQKRVEVWFDDGMDRVSGIYKRHTQIVVGVLGLAVAIILNVDSITLARTLWVDPATRSALVKAAEPAAAAAQPPTMTPEQAKCALDALPLPIGWRDTAARAQACKDGKLLDDGIDMRSALTLADQRVFKKDGSGLWIVIGWIITALAVSFGAPFWFAALQQLFKIRNAGPKPPKTEEGGGTA